MACNFNYLLFFAWLLIVKTDKYLLLFWLCNYYSINTIVSLLVNREIIELYITKNRIYWKNLQSLFKIQMHIRIIMNFFEKYIMFRSHFFLQTSRHVSNEQLCLKPTGLFDSLLVLSNLFQFFYFIFSAPVSFILCSPISPPLLLVLFTYLFIWCSFSGLYQV